jgi:Cu/Zn superoxide dismutase
MRAIHKPLKILFQDENRHMGDLGNVVAGKDGVAKFEMVDEQIQINGQHSVVGRSLVIHAQADDLGKLCNIWLVPRLYMLVLIT